MIVSTDKFFAYPHHVSCLSYGKVKGQTKSGYNLPQTSPQIKAYHGTVRN